jgi:hypothetical protein
MPSRLETSGALKSANKLTEATVQVKPPRPENEVTKFVNLRFKETEHKKIGHLAIEAGITKAEFCKRASLYIMEMVEAGAFSINGGNVIDRRKIL